MFRNLTCLSIINLQRYKYFSIINDIHSQGDGHQREDHAHEDGAHHVPEVELFLLLRHLERVGLHLDRLEVLYET